MTNISHLTTSDAFGFKDKLRLRKPESIAKYLRAVASFDRSPITLADDALMQVVEAVNIEGMSDDDIEIARVEAIINAQDKLDGGDNETVDEEATEDETVEEEAEEIDTGTTGGNEIPLPAAVKVESIDTEAAAFIADAAASKEFNDELNSDIAAGDRVKMAPLNMLLVLRKVYGAKLDTAPMPGTKAGDPDLGNRLPDKRRTVTKKKNGGFTDKWISIYDKMFDHLPKGKEINSELKLIDESETKANKYTGKAIYRENEAKTLRSQRTAGITLVRQSIALHLMLYEVNNLPGIKAEYLADKDKVTPRNSRFPIWVRDPSDPELSETLAITSFLALDPAKAKDAENVKKKGGVYKALITSGARGTSDDESGSNKLPPFDIDIAEEAVASFVTFMSDRVNRAAILKRLNEKDSDGFRRSMVELHVETKPYYDKFSGWYRKVEEAEAAAEASRIEARTAA